MNSNYRDLHLNHPLYQHDPFDFIPKMNLTKEEEKIVESQKSEKMQWLSEIKTENSMAPYIGINSNGNCFALFKIFNKHPNALSEAQQITESFYLMWHRIYYLPINYSQKQWRKTQFSSLLKF